MLSFAYGSSMDIAQTRSRCRNPNLKAECIAKLGDHRLAFTRWSTKRACGVADAVPAPGKEVWGVIFELNDAELELLDESEGYCATRACGQNSYVREERVVCRDGDETQPLKVQVYFVLKKGNFRPSYEYKNLILKGARAHLPQSYISELEKTPVEGS
jgi:hypothetical protein